MSIIKLQKANVNHRDDRGWNISPFWQDSSPVFAPQNIHVVNAPPGTIRANHYHTQRTEYICIIGSEVQIRMLDRRDGAQEDLTIAADEPVILKIEPNIVHAIKNIGKSMSFLICYSDLTYDLENEDIERQRILE